MHDFSGRDLADAAKTLPGAVDLVIAKAAWHCALDFQNLDLFLGPGCS